MTQSAPPPQDLAVATVRGWGQLTTAWVGAAGRWWNTILEWAYDECAYTGVNQTAAWAKVDDTMTLRGEFYSVADSTQSLIPSTCVKIGRTTDEALATGAAPKAFVGASDGCAVLVVSIRPGGVVKPGGYRGKVVDDSNGAAVAESLFVFVATTT
ncbi:MAG: hypothetical protein ABWZ52_03660 [Acidimicrobiales bacterium]